MKVLHKLNPSSNEMKLQVSGIFQTDDFNNMFLSIRVCYNKQSLQVHHWNKTILAILKQFFHCLTIQAQAIAMISMKNVTILINFSNSVLI